MRSALEDDLVDSRDLPCPLECGERFLSEFGAASHLDRYHGDRGRYSVDVATDGGARPTMHARHQWLVRTNNCDTDLREAIEEALSVGSPTVDGQALLHPPTGMILVVRGEAVTTVLYADVEEVVDDHLDRCEACEQRWDPGETDECPWCPGLDVEDAGGPSTEAETS